MFNASMFTAFASGTGETWSGSGTFKMKGPLCLNHFVLFGVAEGYGIQAILKMSDSYENISRIALGQDTANLHIKPIVDLCQTCKLS